jgi:hypothetical protein
MMPGDHGGLGGGGHFNEVAHRHLGGSALGERNVAHGTIKAISGTTFILTTKQGELTVTTSADTNYHSPRQAKEAGYEDLPFAALRVGQRVAVQGERQDDTTLFAKRVHIPKP